ncbi:MAG: replicative DNA helicase [Chloroflexi bacterium]|nr:replicative DNA helicase [Chloroflexota bacterium]
METRATQTPDKLIPHNLDAEQAVLGGLLIDPDAIIKIAPIVRAEDFYLEKHAWIFEAALALHERREPIDFLSVIAELDRRTKLNDAGGAAYITALINAVPTAVHVEHYAHLVEQVATQRKLISAAGQIAGMAYDGSEDIETLIDRAEESIFAVAQRRMSRDLIPIRVAVDRFLDHLDYVQKHQGEILGVPSGFSDLDKLLGGFQPSDLIIIAGRPGSGKTSFALSLMQNAAKDYHKRVALFSLEMSAEQLVQRLVSSMAVIDSQSLRLGRITDDDYPKLVQATGELSETNIFIDDSAALTPIEIRAKARRLQSEFGIDMLIIDYLQLMTVRGNIQNRVQEVSQISRQLKELARELNVPVIALSQLSRAVESRDDHRPQLADLRESGSIEQDADVVVFIYREKTYYPTLEKWQAKHPNKPYPENIAEIIVAKHRHGPTKDLQLLFIDEQAKFGNLLIDSRHDDAY